MRKPNHTEGAAAGLDRRELLRGSAALALAPFLRGLDVPPHAALYLYTEPLYRPRHAAVVAQALRRRHDVHTSGWRRGDDGKPVLEVGPVAKGAFQWHGDQPTGAVSRAWPFVIVLEYDGAHAPMAFIDCFRRASDNPSPGSWMLDPNLGYAEHINAEMVTAQDDRWCYLATADTPTGDVLRNQGFAIRGRVRWGDGRRVQKGWWMTFSAPSNDKDAWHAERTPLVDWRVSRTTSELGIVAVAPVDDPDHELAPWASRTVFRFPDMPEGLVPGRGHD